MPAGYTMCGKKCIDPTVQCCVSDSTQGVACVSGERCSGDAGTCQPSSKCPADRQCASDLCIDAAAGQCCDQTQGLVGAVINGTCFIEPYCPLSYCGKDVVVGEQSCRPFFLYTLHVCNLPA